MGGKNFVGSFSYNVKDSEMMDEAMKMAKADGISFSEFIVSLVKEEVRKKVVGAVNPIGISYISNSSEPKNSLQTDIRQFMRRNDIIKNAEDLTSQECEIIAKNLLRVSRFKRTGVIEI